MASKSRLMSQYEKMSDEELRQILRADAENTGDDGTDMDAQLCAMEVLANRKKERNKAPDAKAAWNNFQKYYLADEIPVSSTESPVPKRIHWKRKLAAVMAAAIIMVGGAIVAVAIDSDLYNIVAKWTTDTFSLTTDEQPNREGNLNKPPKEDYVNLQEALTDYGITTKLVPTWIPEGYELYNVKVYVWSDRRKFSASYLKGEEQINIVIWDYLAQGQTQVQQSATAVEIYPSDGVDYYIFPNLDRWNSVWINNGFECRISGSLTVEEMKIMIDSIKKG